SIHGEGSTFALVLPQRFQGRSTSSSRGGRSGHMTERQRHAGPPPPPDLPRLSPLAGLEDDRDRLTADSRVILVVEDDIAFAGILLDLAHDLDFQCIVTSSADD